MQQELENIHRALKSIQADLGDHKVCLDTNVDKHQLYLFDLRADQRIRSNLGVSLVTLEAIIKDLQ